MTISVHSIIDSTDAIFDENRFSSITKIILQYVKDDSQVFNGKSRHISIRHDLVKRLIKKGS